MRFVIAAVLTLGAFSRLATATDRYVPRDYPTIQAAINACAANDSVVVADGTYTLPGNINLHFDGKDITVRSENGAGACIIDCQGFGRGFYFFRTGETAAAVVDGFTIINGGDAGSGQWDGGAILCEESSPTIRNCVISGNHADVLGNRGGGIAVKQSRTVIIGCTITGNSTQGDGGGVYFDSAIDGAGLESCTIANNTARGENWDSGRGGGVFSEVWGPRVVRCTIWGNSARLGGAVGDTVRVANCEIRANHADYEGGGLWGEQDLTNVLIVGNTCEWYGGGIFGSGNLNNVTITGNAAGWYGGAVYGYSSSYWVRDSILCGDTAPYGNELALENNARAYVGYCDVYGGQPVFVSGASFVVWEGGNINTDPAFVDPSGGDFRLTCTSPCVNAGSNALVPADQFDLDDDGDIGEPTSLDLAGHMRIAQFAVDLGAYEIPFGDLNCDGVMNDQDIHAFALALFSPARYGASYPGCDILSGDFTCDGVVNNQDIDGFIEALLGA